MARPVLNFVYPEIGAKRKNEIALLRASFGDGYTQIAPCLSKETAPRPIMRKAA